jgi:hypothetical protein
VQRRSPAPVREGKNHGANERTSGLGKGSLPRLWWSPPVKRLVKGQEVVTSAMGLTTLGASTTGAVVVSAGASVTGATASTGLVSTASDIMR